MSARFDYIVAGGGSAGCVVASELASDPSVRVLLLESGDSAEDHPETLVADRYKDAFVNPELMWERFSTGQPGCGGRRVFMGSGRGLGGSGSINAMVYTRGAKLDYDEWPEGWRWKDVVTDFEVLEARLRVHRREPTEFTETCIRAAEAAGFRRGEDLNDGDLSGVLGYEWMNYEGTARRSSYVSYVRPHGGKNLTVYTGARVHRVLVSPDGRAHGVEYAMGNGLHRVSAAREIILSAGALETPKILMLSGIGPAEELRRHGIPVLADSPAVGKNFHDHPNVTLFFRGQRDVDCNYPQLYGFHRAREESALPKGQSDTCYVFYPARSSFREGLLRLLPGIVLPERLYEVAALPEAIRKGITRAFEKRPVERFVARMYGIVVILGKPKSRGEVRLRSGDADAPALIDPAYFKDPEDMDTLVQGVGLARRIAQSEPLDAWGNQELMPGPLARTRHQVARFIRKNVMTTYHYAGTCRMGADPGSVVTPTLAVRGVRNLRIADASVIPQTPVSAMNAPSMLVGHRAARFIKTAAE